ncbi:hypothetical protein MCOR25_005171 [Pyricularia grisea]|nr:hypothetical protein MCOR25_005171 [Pyricularia grisea]
MDTQITEDIGIETVPIIAIDPEAQQESVPVRQRRASSLVNVEGFSVSPLISPYPYGGFGQATTSNDHQRAGLTVIIPQAETDFFGSNPSSKFLQEFDIIVIHGLHGNRQSPWINPGAGSSDWIPKSGQAAHQRAMVFGYDPQQILAGSQSRRAIRSVAKQLLDELQLERRSGGKASELQQKRPVLFVAHDIGATILKDALTFAGLEPRLYGEIFDYTRVLIFYGCPHRSINKMDMENRIVRFAFNHDGGKLQDGAAITSLRGFADAVIEINNAFVESKHSFRSYVFSIHAGLGAEGDVNQVFDSFVGTMGVAFETRVCASGEEGDASYIEQRMAQCQDQIVPNPGNLEHERVLLSLASFIPNLSTGPGPYHPFTWIPGNATYRDWLNQRNPQILYIYGHEGVRQASEYIFYHVDDNIRRGSNGEVVLYYSFRRSDVRNNAIKHMLATFLAQLICHFPTLSEIVHAQFERLLQDRGWNDYDLLNWFEYYRLRGEIEGVSCIIHRFEECDQESRQAFLNLFTQASRTQERPWRLCITSRAPRTLQDELKDWPFLDLDQARLQSPRSTVPGDMAIKLEVAELLSHKPELRGLDLDLYQELSKIVGVEADVHRLIVSYVSNDEQWPAIASVQSILGPVVGVSIEDIVERILLRVPEPELGFAALRWLLYAQTALTKWELGAALMIGSDQDDGESIAPPPFRHVDNLQAKILKWFAGIICLEQHELCIEVTKRNANSDITKACLNYLIRRQVRKLIEDKYGDSTYGAVTTPLTYSRYDLRGYAIKYWAKHYAQLNADDQPQILGVRSLLKQMIESGAAATWAKGYWALSSPVLRSGQSFKSLYPLLAGLGLSHSAEPWRQGEEDFANGLSEACLNENLDTARLLLQLSTPRTSTVKEALHAAGSAGHRKIWLELIQHIISNYPNFPWSSMVSNLTRAAWLGYSDVVLGLLGAGCEVEDSQLGLASTPLLRAARGGHFDVVDALLEHRASTKHRNGFGQTALHIAAMAGHADVCRLLVVKGGMDINERDSRQSLSPVYYATLWGNWRVVEVLLELGADPNLGDGNGNDRGWTPLAVAAQEGNFRYVQALLKAKADSNILGPTGTPLKYAVSRGSAEICNLLIAHGATPYHAELQPPILIQAVSAPGLTNRLGIIKILVENGAIIDAATTDTGVTALSLACWLDAPDMLSVVSYLAGRGANVNHEAYDGMTPLHYAARKGNQAVVQILLKANAKVKPKLKAKEQLSPLSHAIKHLDILKLLLDHKADPSRNPPGKLTPLMLGLCHLAKEHRTKFVKILLAYGVDVNVQLQRSDIDPYTGWTALAFAVDAGLTEEVRLLGDAGAQVGLRLHNGRSLVHLALNKDSLSALLEFRPDLNVQDNEGNTPLHCLSEEMRTQSENVKLLVRAGASLNIQNNQGVTPLSVALNLGMDETAKIFLRSGRADVNILSPIIGGPLHVAARRKAFDIMRCLVEAGADINSCVRGNAGSPLQSAVMSSGLSQQLAHETVIYLLDKGADVRKTGGNFGTALAVAAWQGSSPTLLEILLGRGAGPNVPDQMGRQPIHFAALSGRLDFMEILLSAGADATLHDKAGRTIVHWAAQGGQVDVLERALEILGSQAVGDTDSDGWTPLCWAARCWGTYQTRQEPTSQAEIVQFLLENGADVRKGCKFAIGDRKGSVMEISRYYGAPDSVQDLLNIASCVRARSRPVSPERVSRTSIINTEGDQARLVGQNLEIHNEQTTSLHASEGGRQPDVLRLKENPGAYCDYCLCDIAGFVYSCTECINFALCTKCYNTRKRVHIPEHPFHKSMHEFGTGSESSSDTSSSYADSESSDSSSLSDVVNDYVDETERLYNLDLSSDSGSGYF